MKHYVLRLITAGLLGGFGQAAYAAQTTAVVSVNVVKPVVLSKLQDLEFGTLTFSGFTGNRTVTMNRAGAVTCAANIVCSGTARSARFNIQGTNKMVVLITVSTSPLSNGTDSIAFTPDAPPSVTLANSGSPGGNIDVGGSINVSPTLIGGLYSGTMTVTADYQ